MIRIRQVLLNDLPVISEMMHDALDPYYGGDHRAHAQRIVETAAQGGSDRNGHFSAAQIMNVAEDADGIVGLLNFVAKHQSTLKISPLIVHQRARRQGVSRQLMTPVFEYARTHGIRQVYCTVCEQNELALGYFLSQGFVQAGMARGHYRSDRNEIMLYRSVEGDESSAAIDSQISIVPLCEEDEDQVRAMVMSRLSPFFDGVHDTWMDSLFAGYRRRLSGNPNEKYKLIWVAKTHGGKVLGIAAATPKKGEPVKLMPLVADTSDAFSALIAELPGLLAECGHRLYTHAVPSSIEVETLQRHGWQIEAMMPEAYKPGVVTQQWGLSLKGHVMKTLRVKRVYFDAIMAGTKPIEVRVGYDNIRKIRPGNHIKLESGNVTCEVEVTDVRVYEDFSAMLAQENAAHIVPASPAQALEILRSIYTPDKEALGVHAFHLKVVERG